MTTTLSTNAPAHRTVDDVLPADLLARMDERAPRYDRDNTFFTDDFDELRAHGFLTIAVPTELGGAGMTLDQVSQALRRIAYVAPATAVAVNMHVYWTGVAADLLRNGDESMRFVLEQAANGKIFAAIHAESGNDIPLLLSSASADRVTNGWKINGHKIFGSLSPVWDYAGFHAMDTSGPDGPRIVHGFLPRGTAGVEIVDTWDTLGMRATQSHDTVLTDAVCPDALVMRVCPAGFAGADLFQVAVFAWGLLGFAAVYHGAARRAFDLSTANAHARKSNVSLSVGPRLSGEKFGSVGASATRLISWPGPPGSTIIFCTTDCSWLPPLFICTITVSQLKVLPKMGGTPRVFDTSK